MSLLLAERRIVATVVRDEGREIRCRECGAVLALWTPSGRRIVVRLDAVENVERDEQGRVDMDCRCGQRRRLPKGAM